jgi:ribosomal-protein-alanine N-acetyltransferase
MPNSNDPATDTKIRFALMGVTDLDDVVRIEAASFPSPWNRGHFLHELKRNPYAVNRVIRCNGVVIGYASVWILYGELQINKIAIDATRRRRGTGRLLMNRLTRLARETRCHRVSLEVRTGNHSARALYRSLGFVEVGQRADYYGPGEAAILLRLDLAV